MIRRSRLLWVAMLIGLNMLVGACITMNSARPSRPDRGLRDHHAQHLEQELECGMCHEFVDGKGQIPGHDVCGICHEFDLDNPTEETCGFCHTKPDYELLPRTPLIGEHVKFTHDPHVENEIPCSTCHTDPDTKPLARRNMMPLCMECHAGLDPELSQCSVCHTQDYANEVPTFRGNARIPHDKPEVWLRVHGKESKVDPEFCSLCHAQESFCDTCHQQTPPQSHTISWRRKTHGIKASWDRGDCSVCHEEDSCLKCHRNTRPTSHRRGWGKPLDRHCSNCHYQPTRNNCVVCHETIDHRTATPSPHRLGIFPSNCGRCHPAGITGRPPHPSNSTTRCDFCH